MKITKAHVAGALSIYISFVFIQSLFFKFTGSPETDHIFGALDSWAAGLGFPGLFAPGGLFNAHVIGSAELVASILMLAGLFLGRPLIQGIGALMSLGVISGAIFFHLFTPLGVEVVNTDGSSDGGLLFIMACGVWISAAVIIWLRRDILLALLPLPAAKGRA